MFEQKINTVSIRVNEESFAVVPFDNYKDAVQAAKQALVALNNGERVELLGKRLDVVERALAEEKARNTTVLLTGGRKEGKSCFLEMIGSDGKLFDFVGGIAGTEELNGKVDAGYAIKLKEYEPPKETPEKPERKAEMLDLRQSAPLPKARHPDLSPGDLITWGYQDDGIIMAITSNADIASEWIKEGKKVFEIQQKPINY